MAVLWTAPFLTFHINGITVHNASFVGRAVAQVDGAMALLVGQCSDPMLCATFGAFSGQLAAVAVYDHQIAPHRITAHARMGQVLSAASWEVQANSSSVPPVDIEVESESGVLRQLATVTDGNVTVDATPPLAYDVRVHARWQHVVRTDGSIPLNASIYHQVKQLQEMQVHCLKTGCRCVTGSYIGVAQHRTVLDPERKVRNALRPPCQSGQRHRLLRAHTRGRCVHSSHYQRFPSHGFECSLALGTA